MSSSVAPLGFHMNLTAFVKGRLVPNSISPNGTIDFVPMGQDTKLPELISLNGERVEPDKIPGFLSDPGREESADKYKLGHDLAHIQEWTYIQPFSSLVQLSNTFIGGEREAVGALEGTYGNSTLIELAKMGVSSRTAGVSQKEKDIRALAELCFARGACVEQKGTRWWMRVFAAYFASGILSASLGKKDDLRRAENAFLLGASVMTNDALAFMPAMMYDLVAEIRRAEPHTEFDRFVFDRTAAKRWATPPLFNEVPSCRVFRMFRSMWHAYVGSDFEVFADQNRNYGNSLPLSGSDNLREAAWAFARSAWALSEAKANGAGIGWKEIHGQLGKMDAFFSGLEGDLDPAIKAKSIELLDQALKILTDSRK